MGLLGYGTIGVNAGGSRGVQEAAVDPFHERGLLMSITPIEQITPDTVERAACHEAGHGVAHRHFGRRISYIFITTDGNGITSITKSVHSVGPPKQPAPLVPDHTLLVVAMAGRAAEAIQYPTLPRDELIRLSMSDEEQARDFVRDLYGKNLTDEQVTAYVNAAEAEASHLLRKAWPAVVALARALRARVLTCGLDGDEAMTIMDDALLSLPPTSP
jgi:hypothetical protein